MLTTKQEVWINAMLSAAASQRSALEIVALADDLTEAWSQRFGGQPLTNDDIESHIEAAAKNCGPLIADQVAAIEALGPLIGSASNPVLVELYINQVADRFNLPRPVAKEALRKGYRESGASPRPRAR